jgi:alcohol dehydrogenase class IV
VVPYIEADIAVLDANLTLGLPPGLTASTGMDALTHALEALASPAANHFTDAHATTAAQLLEANLPVVVENGRNVQARHDVLQASTLAIDAFCNALNAIPVHNCAHAFGALYHIPHGDANSVLLPIVMEVLSEFYLPNAARLARALNLETRAKDNASLLDEVIANLRRLQEKTGCMTTFAQYEISGEELPKIVMAVATDPAGMFYPIPPARIEQIVQQAMG